MNRLRVLATIFIVVVAALGIWVASTGMKAGRTDTPGSGAPQSAYDYEVRDVVVQQMGPDGSLQYELSAKQIAQQPESGRITASQLVIHRDPAGSAPDGPNRWTLRADRADLPEPGSPITLQGKVRAEGLPEKSRARISVATDELTYNLQTQEVSTRKPVDLTWGSNRFRSGDGDVYVNMKTGAIKVDSESHATYVPR